MVYRNFIFSTLFFALVSCGFDRGSTPEVRQFSPAESVSEGLQVCASAPITLEGIDVSFWQGTIDWTKVAGAGKKFASTRFAYGTSIDSTFKRNWDGMKAAGLYRGAYQYFIPNVDPIVQADAVINVLGKLQPGDLPVMADVEFLDSDGRCRECPAPAVYAANLKKWADRIEQGTGRTPMFYSYKYYWEAYLGNSSLLNGLPYAHAQYSVYYSCPLVPSGIGKWTLWQYRGSAVWERIPNGTNVQVPAGSCPGVNGDVDLDHFNGTLDDLKALAGIVAPPPPPPVEAPGKVVGDGPAPGAMVALSDPLRFDLIQPARLFDAVDAGTVSFSNWKSLGLTIADKGAALIDVVVQSAEEDGGMIVAPSGSVDSTLPTLDFSSNGAVIGTTIVPLDADTGISFQGQKATHFSANVIGIFSNEGKLGFLPTAATRIVDGTALVAGVPTPIDVHTLAPTAEALSLVVNSASPATSGQLIIGPCSTIATSDIPALFFEQGVSRSNFTTATVESGSLCLLSSVNTSVTVDVVGTWSASSKLDLVTTRPVRVLDTQNRISWDGRLNEASPVAIQVGKLTGIPSTATAGLFRFRLTGADTKGSFTAYPCNDAVPSSSPGFYFDAHSATTQLIPIAWGSAGQICVSSTVRIHLAVESVGYFVPGPDAPQKQVDPVVPATQPPSSAPPSTRTDVTGGCQSSPGKIDFLFLTLVFMGIYLSKRRRLES